MSLNQKELKNMEATVNKEKKIFFNHSFDKKRLKALISWIFKQSGEAEALKVVDILKETGFRHATKAGISIGLHDLTTPIQKSWLISESQLAISTTDRDFSCAKITATERSQRIVDTWHRASESLSKQVVDYFGIYDRFNPVYIMALSGARGNFSQVRQLIGMRGLMADQQGKIVSFPIRSNLREGLTLTEYFISCSGARKGLVDTALRTADTGYLTRRLVDVSHHVVVKRIRCNTNRGIVFKSLQSYNKIALSLKERLVGRVLAENIFQPSKKLLAKKDQEISLKLSLKIAEVRDKVYLRSPLTCGFTHSVCQLCYGWSISQGSLVALGDAVGVIAAQSIGEPGTQLTMRTFHTGGVFSGDLLQEIRAPHAGKVEFSKAFQGLLIRTAHGRIAFLSKTEGHIILSCDQNTKFPKENEQRKDFCKKNIGTFTQNLIENGKKGPSLTTIPIPAFTMLFIRQGEQVENNQLLAEFSIRTNEGNQPIKTQQTIFALLSGRVIEDCSGKVYTKTIKESALSLEGLRDQKTDSSSEKAPLYKSLNKASTKGYALTHIRPNEMHVMPLLAHTARREVCARKARALLNRDKVHVGGALYTQLCMRKFGSSICKCKAKVVSDTLLSISGKRKLIVAKRQSPHSKLQEPRFESRLARLCRARDGFAQGHQIKDLYPSPKVMRTAALWRMPLTEGAVKVHAITGTASKAKRKFASLRLHQSFSGQRKKHSKGYALSSVKANRSSNTGLRNNTRNGEVIIEGKALKNRQSSICKAKILSLYKNEDLENDLFRFIEPTTSGRLGFLKILSTRVGANLDYICPIKSFDIHFIKRSKIYTFIQASKSNICTQVQAVPLFLRTNRNFFTHTCVRTALTEGVTSKLVKAVRSDLDVSPCAKRSFISAPVRASSDIMAIRSAKHLKQSEQIEDLYVRKKICMATACPLGKQFTFSNYLHPEAIKENRFFLQTVAEYGDIVDESYKKNSFKKIIL